MQSITRDEAELLARVDEHDVVGLLRELVRRPSFVDETAVVEYLDRRWRGLGLEPTVTAVEPRRSNITVQAGRPGPSLLFNSHMDTVPPGEASRWTVEPFGGEVRGGRVWGRGAVDAKGCLAAMIAAFETLASRGGPGTVLLSAVAYEENGGYGTKADVERGLRAGAALIGEPTNLQPNLGHRGALRIEVECLGRPAHSAQPTEGVNAITAAGAIAVALERLDREHLAGRSDDVLRQRPNLTVTVIQGGDAGNVVPARCTMLLDRRTLPGEAAEAAVAEVRAAIDRAGLDPRVEVRLRDIRHAPGAAIAPDAPVAAALTGAVESVRGRPSKPGGFFACCDMTYLAGAGIPTAIFGPGEEGMCHVFDERLAVEDLRDAARIYALTASRWLRGDG